MTKILLVEDDKSLREIYNVRLRAEGYDIVAAGDGEEALALAIKERPDLIVSDVMMPKISGFDMLDILRSTTETKNVKVIMMTALSSEEQRQRGISLGADRYLVKSQVGIEDVVRTVHEVLNDSASAGQAPLVSPQINAPQASAAPQPQANFAPTASAPIQAAAPTAPAPAPTPISQPTPPIQPAASPAPQPLPQPSLAAPSPVTAQTAPSPAAAQAPPAQNPATQASTLPQPVAPLSTPRPGSSGKIIQPITSADPASAIDFTARMSQELSGTPAIANIPQPQPAVTTAPAPQVPAVEASPSVAPVTIAATEEPAFNPQAQPAAPPLTPPVQPPQNITSPQISPELTFEETARTTTPQTPPQAPAA